MREVVAATLLVFTIGCSSKGDSPQGGGGSNGDIGLGGVSLTTGGTISTGGQASGGVMGAGGSVATGGAIGSGGKPSVTGGAMSSGGKTSDVGGAISSGGKTSTTGGTIGSGGKPSDTGGAMSSGGKSGNTGGAMSSGGKTSDVGGAMSSGGKTGGVGGKTGSGGQATGGVIGADGGTSSPTNPLSQTLIDEFVTAHNNARSGAIVALNPTPSPALPTVSWDPILADSAYNYLMKCQSSDGTMVSHNANRSSDYVALGGSGYVGENIYAMQGGAAKPTDAVTLWMGEASSYDYATNTGDAGHYTQVVWRDSVRIGCAIVTCSAVKYSNTILCDYAPGGNFNGQKPY